MMLSANTMERRLQLAGIILIVGLLVEGFALMGRGPIAFLALVGVGGLLLIIGILVYLLALVRTDSAQS
jgi:hypothetical protein